MFKGDKSQDEWEYTSGCFTVRQSTDSSRLFPLPCSLTPTLGNFVFLQILSDTQIRNSTVSTLLQSVYQWKEKELGK